MTGAGTALSRFTPSLMSRDLLERLFVARERTLESIVGRVEAAAESTERNHTLLVGPRGSGKTHLVSLVYHRASDLRARGARLQLAWLPEDPWTIASYKHLLVAVAERLEPKLDVEVPRSDTELESLLIERASRDGPIVVIVENLDQVLRVLGNKGQQRLRHLLQDDRSLLLVATSTRLDRALSDQASPFYAFFTTTRLEPFDIDEAAEMLTAIATERRDDKLVEYLGTEEGRARLRAVTHLAGGQPRLWAALASALSVDGLRELVELLLTRFDDLTPYYQEQLGRLSPHQRLVVAELAEADRPFNVSELAERVEIEPRSLAKTMHELVDRGWAMPITSPLALQLDRRRTYYELAEPLARLSFQIKESRGQPVRLIVEFLKHWFDASDLRSTGAEGQAAEYLLLASEGHGRDAVLAVTRNLRRLPVTRAPTVALLSEVDSALSALMDENPEPLIRLPAPIRGALEDKLRSEAVLGVRFDIHDAAISEFGHTRHPDMAEWIARAEEMVIAATGKERTDAQLLLADWLGRAWRFDEAEEVLAAADGAKPFVSREALVVGARVAASYQEAGRYDAAVDLAEEIVRRSAQFYGADDPEMLVARSDLAVAYFWAGRADEAIELQRQVLELCERVLGFDHRDTLTARANLAVSLHEAGSADEAVRLLETVVSDSERVRGSDDAETLGARANLAAAYFRAGSTDEALRTHEAALRDLRRVLGEEHPQTSAAYGNLAVAYSAAGRAEEAIELEERALAQRERTLGREHPRTLIARANLAASYDDVGRTREAIALEESVLADRRAVLGAGHPDTLAAGNNLAHSYAHAGRTREAITLMESVVAEMRRLNGADDPDTVDATAALAIFRSAA
jgi:tetratricopeptide (TPR) repeat protein